MLTSKSNKKICNGDSIIEDKRVEKVKIILYYHGDEDEYGKSTGYVENLDKETFDEMKKFMHRLLKNRKDIVLIFENLTCFQSVLYKDDEGNPHNLFEELNKEFKEYNDRFYYQQHFTDKTRHSVIKKDNGKIKNDTFEYFKMSNNKLTNYTNEQKMEEFYNKHKAILNNEDEYNKKFRESSIHKTAKATKRKDVENTLNLLKKQNVNQP